MTLDQSCLQHIQQNPGESQLRPDFLAQLSQPKRGCPHPLPPKKSNLESGSKRHWAGGVLQFKWISCFYLLDYITRLSETLGFKKMNFV